MPQEQMPGLIYVTESVTGNSLPRRGHWEEHHDGVEGVAFILATEIDAPISALAERVERAEALLALKNEYIEYMNECDMLTAGYLHVHNWKYPAELLKRGEALRSKIAELESRISSFLHDGKVKP